MQNQAVLPRLKIVRYRPRKSPESVARHQAAIEILQWTDAMEYVLFREGPPAPRDRHVYRFYDKAMRFIITAQRFIIVFLIAAVITLLTHGK